MPAADTLGPPRFVIPQSGLAKLLGAGPRDDLLSKRAQAGGRPTPVPAQYNPGGPGGGREVAIPGAQVARCFYGLRSINFWLQQRPVLDAVAIRELPHAHFPMADVAIVQCPERLVEAMRLAVGPDFEARIATAQAAERAKSEQKDRDDRSRAEDERAARSRWKEGASALQAARVTALWQAADRALAAEEARGTPIQERPASAMSAPTQAFAARMRRELYPPLLELARGGFAEGRSLNPDEAGRAAFEQWDRGAAGRALTAIGRLQRLWPAGWWDLEQVAAIEADLLRTYSEQLRGRGLFDATTRARIVQALERRRVESAQRLDPPQALSPAASPTSTRVVFLRPGELAAYRLGQSIGNGLRGLGDAAGKAGQVRQMVVSLDKRLGTTRRAFWSCWETRCTDIADRWVDYSQALREKDWYHLNHVIIDSANRIVLGSRGGQATDLFQAMAGLRQIDGGPLPSCEQPFDRLTVRVQTFVQQKLMRNPFDFGAIAGFSDELLASPEQRDYQACRDAVEMGTRPRGAGTTSATSRPGS